MRIHFIVRTFNEKTGGGSHHNALTYMRFLNQQGHTLIVHSFAKGDTVVPADIQIQIHEYGTRGFANANKELCNLLRENESSADVFFLYGVDFLWGAGQYRKERGSVPVAVYLDNYLPSMNLASSDSGNVLNRNLYRLKRIFWEKTIGYRYIQFVDRYIAVSPFLKDIYIKSGFPTKRFVVVPNAFIFPKEKPVTRELHQEVRLLYAGRLIYDKGVDLLISALARCSEYKWKLTIVGSGPLLDKCQKLVRTNNLEERISFIPWVASNELARLYEESDIFVHPARWPEPFGRTLVEAMWHGLALIVPERGAAAWLAGDCACVFSNMSQKELETSIQKLLTDSVFRAELALRGPNRARKFDSKNVCPQLIENLEEIRVSQNSDTLLK